MKHISTTPFGRRAVSAGLLATQALATAPCPVPARDKWAVLRDLGVARRAFGVSDRDLAVLQALLSFLPGSEIADGAMTIVFPSNATLAARTHGMAESTLRRHLAALVTAGLILRHDSPNGKRYAARGEGGAITRAFGLDLRPLLARAAEIAAHAETARTEAEAIRQRREAAVLHLRDAAKLAAYGATLMGGNWDAVTDAAALLQRSLRRQLTLADAEALEAQAAGILASVTARITPETEETSADAAQNERHIQDSEQNPSESESCNEHASANPAQLPLHIVLNACPDIRDYAPHGIRHWHDLVATAAHVSPMMGITPETWREAQKLLSPEVAALTVACILQRIAAIPRPGAYLRALARKSTEGRFTPGPMVMALLRVDSRHPS